jgi:ATP-dependent Lhr-like helicase
VVRGDFTWLDETGTALVRDEAGKLRWWTFAGQLANSSLSSGLSAVGLAAVSCDNLSLVLPREHDDVSQALASLREQASAELAPAVSQEALRQLKFAQCLPFELGRRSLAERLQDPESVAAVLTEPSRRVGLGRTG